MDPNRREVSEMTPKVVERHKTQHTLAKRNLFKLSASPEIAKSHAEVKRIIRSLEKIEDGEGSGLTDSKISSTAGNDLSGDSFRAHKSEKINFNMEDEPSGEPGDWEGGEFIESGEADDDEPSDDILQSRMHGVSVVKRTETAASEFKHSGSGKMMFGSVHLKNEENEKSGNTEESGESDFVESGSSETSAWDVLYSEDFSNESASGSEGINETLLREVKHNLPKEWLYAATKSPDMVGKGPKGKDDETKLLEIYNLVIKHESSRSDSRKPSKESVSGEASGRDIDFSDFFEQSADGSALEYRTGSAFSGEDEIEEDVDEKEQEEEEPRAVLDDVSDEMSGEHNELSGESVSGSGAINKKLMIEVERNLHSIWRYAALKKDLDMVAKGPKGKEEEDKLKNIYNIVSKHESGSAFIDFEKKKEAPSHPNEAIHEKSQKNSGVKFAKQGGKTKLITNRKARKLEYNKKLRNTGKSRGKFIGRVGEKANNSSRLQNGTAKVQNKSKNIQMVILGEEMKEMAPGDEELRTSKPGDAKVNERKESSTDNLQNKPNDHETESTKTSKPRKQIIFDQERPIDKSQEEIGKTLEQMILTRVEQLENQKLGEKVKGKKHHWKARKEKDDSTEAQRSFYKGK